MKLLTVFTGGTISCSVSDGVLAPDSQNGSYLLGLARQAGVRDDFETVQPFSVLSENMTPDCLRQLRRCITERLGEGYDGVLVTHGTDTLAYTAAYLDFVLGAQDTPVVLVSANYPLRDSRSNGLQNFVAAVEFLRTGKRGVFVAYHNTGDSRTTIHRGREVLPQAPYEDSVFSLFMQPCGWMENGGIRTREVYRFLNGVMEENGRLVWDTAALTAHVRAGIDEALRQFPRIESLSVDTWAVDLAFRYAPDRHRGAACLLPRRQGKGRRRLSDRQPRRFCL